MLGICAIFHPFPSSLHFKTEPSSLCCCYQLPPFCEFIGVLALNTLSHSFTLSFYPSSYMSNSTKRFEDKDAANNYDDVDKTKERKLFHDKKREVNYFRYLRPYFEIYLNTQNDKMFHCCARRT